MDKSCSAVVSPRSLKASVSFVDGVKVCSRVSVSRATLSSETKV